MTTILIGLRNPDYRSWWDEVLTAEERCAWEARMEAEGLGGMASAFLSWYLNRLLRARQGWVVQSSTTSTVTGMVSWVPYA